VMHLGPLHPQRARARTLAHDRLTPVTNHERQDNGDSYGRGGYQGGFFGNDRDSFKDGGSFGIDGGPLNGDGLFARADFSFVCRLC
jgi:hypothetical protein